MSDPEQVNCPCQQYKASFEQQKTLFKQHWVIFNTKHSAEHKQDKCVFQQAKFHMDKEDKAFNN